MKGVTPHASVPSARRSKRKLLPAVLAFVVGAAFVVDAAPARATIVERVVAVIGERPLLWSDLLKRATATRVQIRMQTHDPNVVAVQEQEMYKELLQKLIDERLEEQQADKAHINITPDEVDRGIANIAAQAQAQQGRPVTVDDVLSEVRRRGLTDQDFRDEIHRQIMEGKLIELRVRPRVRVTEQDAHAAYQHWLQEMREQELIDVRILALRVLPGLSRAQIAARQAFAQTLAQQAQSGKAAFCNLVMQYSDDVSTRSTCGSHGPQPFRDLLPPIQTAVRTLAPGSVSDPIAVQIGSDDVIVILQVPQQPSVQSYEAMKNEMMQRALLEGLERARKQWLDELRHNVYIDVRL